MSGDHNPSPTATLGAEVFHDGLEIQHQTAVPADESSHLVHKEDEPTAVLLLVEVFLDVLAETLDAQSEVALGVIDPFLG